MATDICTVCGDRVDLTNFSIGAEPLRHATCVPPLPTGGTARALILRVIGYLEGVGHDDPIGEWGLCCTSCDLIIDCRVALKGAEGE